MKITQEVRAAAAQGMEEMSTKFREGGSEIYAGAEGRAHD